MSCFQGQTRFHLSSWIIFQAIFSGSSRQKNCHAEILKFEIFKAYNKVCLEKVQCWPLWLSIKQKILACQQFSHNLTLFFRLTVSHNEKRGSCHDKMSVLLSNFFFHGRSRANKVLLLKRTFAVFGVYCF